MKNELEYQNFKGLIVFCNKCKSNIHNNQTSKRKCSHPLEKQVYKAIVKDPNAGGQRRTKILSSRIFNEAIVEFIKYKKEVENKKPIKSNIKTKKSEYFLDTVQIYLDYLMDVDVVSYEKRNLSQSHIKTTMSLIKDFLVFIKNLGLNINQLKITDIDKVIIDKYYTYLKETHSSNYTFNHKIKAWRTIYNYLINEKEYRITNFWKKITLLPEDPTDISISADDFFDLLDAITPENAVIQCGKKTRRNMYEPWLKDLVQLKAYTGCRNAELYAMRWNMIHFEKGKPLYIGSPNLKVNRKNQIFDNSQGQNTYIPIAEELCDLFYALGLATNVNSNKYIIAPDIINRDTIELKASKSFTFYFSKLNRDYSRNLKHLRQTYITQQALFFQPSFSMQHSDVRVAIKHYINRKDIAIDMVKKGFRVFPKRHSIALQTDTPAIKKDLAISQSLDFQGGEYRNRTDDLLTASQTL